MSAKARGTKRENDLVKLRRAEGWSSHRTPGSMGTMDTISAKAGERLLYEQVKTDPYPYKNFPPRERAALLAEAELAGAEALLCHWPPDRGGPRWLGPSDWPQ